MKGLQNRTLFKFAFSLLVYGFACAAQAATPSWTVSPDSPIPARRSRLSFQQSLKKIKNGWLKAQVQALLGPPDDIWSSADSSDYSFNERETWCFGTNGRRTAPTLGRVVFELGKTIFVYGGDGEPPSPGVIGEGELVRCLRSMYRPPNMLWPESGDTQRLIQCANLLITEGREKALAILLEDDRLELDLRSDRQSWLFWLVRVAFVSSSPAGEFPAVQLGAINPPPPNDLKSWPTFPVVLVDDIPFSFYEGANMGGPFNFTGYLKRNESSWTLKTRILRPPEDPFLAYQKLKSSAVYKLSKDAGYGMALIILLNLVKTVTGMPPRKQWGPFKPIEAYHEGFLASKPYWDSERQEYVRGDGSLYEDKME